MPSGLLPSGVASWLSTDAGGWGRNRPAKWARPLWSVLGLLFTAGAAVVVEPDPVCGGSAPCGPDLCDMIKVGLILGLLYWYVWLPEIALVATLCLAVLLVWPDSLFDGAVTGTAQLGVLAALVLGGGAAWSRLAARRRQRKSVAWAAVVRHRPPGAADRVRRGTTRIAVGALLTTVAAGSGIVGLAGVREDERHTARAVRTSVEVVDREARAVRVRTGDGRRLSLDVSRPGHYRVGSALTVLEDGRWRRPANEPYDPFGPHLLATAVGLPGLVLLGTGVIIRRRVVRLRRGVPALRVLLRSDHRGRNWVYTADDTWGRTPRFSCFCESASPPGPPDGSVGRRVTGGAALDEDLFDADTRLRQAVMFGEPYERGELVFVTTVGDGTPVVLRTVEPVRLAGAGPAPEAPAVEPGAVPCGSSRIGWAAASLRAAGEPVRWGPGTPARALGGAMAACIALGAKALSGRLAAGGPDEHVVALLGLLVLIHPAATLLNWRVTADGAGLWLTGAWTARHVPWQDLASAVHTRDGSVRIRLTDGRTWQLPGLPRPEDGSRRGSPPAYVRMAEEISALCAHPELRPTEESPRGDRALPLGPLLLLVAGLAATASFLG